MWKNGIDYNDIIEQLNYSLSFDFDVPWQLLSRYILGGASAFLIVLGLHIGIRFLRECIE